MSTREWLPEEVERELLLLSQGPEGSALSERARIILLSANGHTAEQVSRALRVVPLTIYKWRKRFRELGIEGLRDLPRPGQPRKLTEERFDEILRITREQIPADGTRWSIRQLAQAADATEYQVRSVWEHSGVSEENLRMMQVKHALRSKGQDFELSAVLVAPPLCVAVLSVGHSPASQERTSVRPESTRQRRGSQERRRSSDSFFRIYDEAGGAVGWEQARVSQFLGEVLRDRGDADALHVISSRADVIGGLESFGGVDLRSHVLSSASLFLTLLEDLAGLIEVRARTRNVHSGVFGLRSAMKAFVADAENPGRGFSWRSQPERVASKKSALPSELCTAPAQGAAPQLPLRGARTWHRCDAMSASRLHG